MQKKFMVNKLKQSENKRIFFVLAVTEDYTCPFCVRRCSELKVNWCFGLYLCYWIWFFITCSSCYDFLYFIFQGLRCHLNASHDLFMFEFIVSAHIFLSTMCHCLTLTSCLFLLIGNNRLSACQCLLSEGYAWARGSPEILTIMYDRLDNQY